MGSSRLAAAGLAAPAAVIVVGLLIVPLGIALCYSALTPGAYGGVTYPWSTDAYTSFLFDRDFDDTLHFTTLYAGIFWRSISLSVISTILCFLIGFPMAWFIVSKPANRRGTLLALVIVPFFTNTLIRTYAWVLLLRDTGLVNNALVQFGLLATPLHLIYNDAAILLGLTVTLLPFMVLPIYAALVRIDTRLIEAALDLYASKAQILRHVVLPLAGPGIRAGALLVLAPALGSFLVPDMLGGGQHLLIGSLIQNQFSSGRNWPFGAALSMLITVPLLIVFTRMSRSKALA